MSNFTEHILLSSASNSINQRIKIIKTHPEIKENFICHLKFQQARISIFDNLNGKNPPAVKSSLSITNTTDRCAKVD